MVSTVLVPTTLPTDSKKFSSSAKDAHPSIDLVKIGKVSFNRKRKLAAPGMDSFREKLSSEEISKESISLLQVLEDKA